MLDKYNLTLEQNIFIAKRNLVDYIWKSANLEGIAVTYPETQDICNGMSINGHTIEEINAVNDLKHAWMFMLDHIDNEMDLELIKQIHQTLGKFTVINAGSLRIQEVRIGGTDWIPPIPNEKETQDNITSILADTTTATETAINLMLYLMRSQLFYDGNKRIAMMAANKIMIHKGAGIISIAQKNKNNFLSLLVEFYETGKSSTIKQFVYDHCIDGIAFSKEDKIESRP